MSMSKEEVKAFVESFMKPCKTPFKEFDESLDYSSTISFSFIKNSDFIEAVQDYKLENTNKHEETDNAG